MKFLSRQEELILLSILKLGADAYGVTIRQHVTKVTGKYWSIGAVYDVLNRLTRKGLVSAIAGKPSKVRGGKSKRYYRISKSGINALDEIRKLQKKGWVGISDYAYEKK